METRLSRRAFLAKAAAGATGLTILALGLRCGATPTTEIVETAAKETPLVEKVIEETIVPEVVTEVRKEVIESVEQPVEKIVADEEICLACRECEVACSLYHEGKCNPALSRIEVDFDDFTAGFPQISVSAKCDLCADRSQGPVCVEVCPAGALTLTPA